MKKLWVAVLTLTAIPFLSGAQPAGSVFECAVKTNLAAAGVGVANLGAEIGLPGCYSLDFPVYFSPYDLGRPDRKLRVLAFQPELRRWLDWPMRGFYAGVHVHWGWFNVATPGRNRYQDYRPVLGGGVGCGYSQRLSRHLNAELSLGAGYARIDYDTYQNTPDGAKIGRTDKNYWGLTRFGIGVVYKFEFPLR